jgi:DNA-binding NarL/FixJ family response regulator
MDSRLRTAPLTRVLIADDQPLMRSALRMCFEPEPDLDVVGEAADGIQAVELSRRLRPDVVVMDVRMPILDGVAATAQLSDAASDHRPGILVITTFQLDDYVLDALRAGASGFLLKDATPDELVRAVRVIAEGNALIAPAATRALLDHVAARLPARVEPLPGLTGRERDVLELLAHGLSNIDIATTLRIAPSSVKSHIGHLLTKLNVSSRLQLVVFAYESGLIRLRGH